MKRKRVSGNWKMKGLATAKWTMEKTRTAAEASS
ncbi:hypothetical protein SAMN05216550_113229 [Paraburkholderia tropica]|uniref:Uncharacterized protein n=1 Tax=Paraburkholderia tropica TaxID=92647 RepID=A0AAQ1GJN1_9BURK|nr:hypothetical protein SAMN05216550_113229 [Paraburkholderia tropica]